MYVATNRHGHILGVQEHDNNLILVRMVRRLAKCSGRMPKTCAMFRVGASKRANETRVALSSQICGRRHRDYFILLFGVAACGIKFTGMELCFSVLYLRISLRRVLSIAFARMRNGENHFTLTHTRGESVELPASPKT